MHINLCDSSPQGGGCFTRQESTLPTPHLSGGLSCRVVSNRLGVASSEWSWWLSTQNPGGLSSWKDGIKIKVMRIYGENTKLTSTPPKNGICLLAYLPDFPNDILKCSQSRQEQERHRRTLSFTFIHQTHLSKMTYKWSSNVSGANQLRVLLEGLMVKSHHQPLSKCPACKRA